MLQIPEAIINSIESLQLQVTPQVLLRFLYLVEDDRTTMSELAAIVSQDPALSARVLMVAKSSALYQGTASKNLTQCLVKLGTHLTRTLASCLAVQNVFSSASNNRKYDLSGFWSHSLLVAEVAREISTDVAYPDVEEAHLSGLLHDIGQLLLLGGMEECYGRLLESSIDEMGLLAFEKKTLGTDHMALGAWLADQWELSSFMADSILFHHKTAEEIASADQLSQIVWSSHVLCDQVNVLDITQKKQAPDLEAITAMLGIDIPRLVFILRNCSKRVAVIAEALGITELPTSKTFPSTVYMPHENQQLKLHDNYMAHARIEESVRDMAMMQPLQHDMALLTSEAEILLGIRESARILFGPGHLAFLLVQADKPVLSGASIAGQPDILQNVEIVLTSTQSFAANVALGTQHRSTFEEGCSANMSLTDTQIIRALGSEGVVYLPLAARAKNIGVIAFGISKSQYLRLCPQLPWMMNFARMAANSIETWRSMQVQKHSVEAALTKRFEQQAHKVFHETGNPLSIINNYLSIIRKKMPDTNNLHQELDILREEIDRVTKIVRQMSSLPDMPSATATLDINVLIESMLVLYGKTLFSSRGITVEKTLDPELIPMAHNRDGLKQVLVNLWNNAADAMVPGGCMSISTHADVNQDGKAYIEIRMSDTGPGLPPDVMQRLFQPLDPNRRPGHSGVGLSIVAGLIEQLNGRIICRSSAGHGTSFSILLPKTREN
ncbi:MAG: HDOD domain-containing protein [Desulfuromonadaceae bacterium]|nr:HDOD domain-containing protein [Desulfuromonadaceae bacterium]